MDPTLNFKHTIHDRIIYKTAFKGPIVLLLQQVDEMIIQTNDEDTAKAIFMIIRLKLQLENEDDPPFVHLGHTVSFNGVDIEQSKSHIKISCKNYMDRMLQAHSLDTAPSKPFPWLTKTPSLFPDNTVHEVYKECGPDKGTAAMYALELKASFDYCTLLGKMMYAYITCCPDINYAITTMPKISTKLSDLHYNYLKQVAKYLCLTKDWDIKFKCITDCPELKQTKF